MGLDPTNKKNEAINERRTLAEEFYQKYFKMVVNPQEEIIMSKTIKIALVAGHCLTTPGKRVPKQFDPNETREWVLNDRICDMLETELAQFNVSVLRVDDTTGKKDISLANRTKAIRAFNPDVALEIHHNAGINGGYGGGVVVYFNSKQGTTKNMARTLYENIVACNHLVGNRSVPVKDQTSLYMTNNNKGPYFLVENGFMDSATDAPIILTDDFAADTVRGIMNFLIGVFAIERISSKPEEEKPSYHAYTVKSGDTLSKIAAMYNVSVSAIVLANNLPNPNKIKVGQVLKIPVSNRVPTPEEFHEGDKVKVLNGATWWNGKKISSWVFGTTMYYRGKNTNGAIISKNKTGSVTGTIKPQYLSKI